MAGKRLSSNLPPIRSIEALAATLGINQDLLVDVAGRSGEFWLPGSRLTKKNGEVRQTSSAKPELKRIHTSINRNILRKFQYPDYLHGSIHDPGKPSSVASNAAVHEGARILIEEDIADFFPGISQRIVRDIWLRCFHFSEDVAALLTSLTTYQESLPQGWAPSSYLANLAFWDNEPWVVEQLHRMGCRYSRYVDDVAISSRHYLSEQRQQRAVQLVYGMMIRKGLSPKRSKHNIATRRRAMQVTGLSVNQSSATLPKQYRRNLQAEIHKLEKDFSNPGGLEQYRTRWRSAQGKAQRVKGFNQRQGEKFLAKLESIKL